MRKFTWATPLEKGVFEAYTNIKDFDQQIKQKIWQGH